MKFIPNHKTVGQNPHSIPKTSWLTLTNLTRAIHFLRTTPSAHLFGKTHSVPYLKWVFKDDEEFTWWTRWEGQYWLSGTSEDTWNSSPWAKRTTSFVGGEHMRIPQNKVRERALQTVECCTKWGVAVVVHLSCLSWEPNGLRCVKLHCKPKKCLQKC